MYVCINPDSHRNLREQERQGYLLSQGFGTITGNSILYIQIFLKRSEIKILLLLKFIIRFKFESN
jgi:hypothetical protein